MKYKVERQIPDAKTWYEVILSPFETKQQALDYYNKYNVYYPAKHAVYRITNTANGSSTILKRD